MESPTITTLKVTTRIDKAISKEASRYSIDGALVRPHTDPDLAWLTATDGHMLACVPVEATGDRAPADYLPMSVVPTTKKGDTVTRNGQWQSGRKFAPLTPDEEVGTFPPCWDILPDIDPTSPTVLSISLNAQKLHNLADALGSSVVTLIIDTNRDVSRTDAEGLQKVVTPHVTKPIRVIPAATNDCDPPASVGVMMPCSTSTDAPATYQFRIEQYKVDHKPAE